MKNILLFGTDQIKECLATLFPDAAVTLLAGETTEEVLNPYAAHDLLVFAPDEAQRNLLTEKFISDLFTYVLRGGTMLVLAGGLAAATHPELCHLIAGKAVGRLPYGEYFLAGDAADEATISFWSSYTLMDFSLTGARDDCVSVQFGNASYPLLYTQYFCKGKVAVFLGDANTALFERFAAELSAACGEEVAS